MRPSILMLSSAWLIAMAGAALPATVRAQTGVDDDRVSLPQGPGSLEGIGDDVQFDPNMGSMSHEISIDLPSGFPGATPSLSLSYSSAAGSGPLGIGWSMSTPVSNSMVMVARPWVETDLISLTPSRPCSSVSTGRARSRSAS